MRRNRIAATSETEQTNAPNKRKATILYESNRVRSLRSATRRRRVEVYDAVRRAREDRLLPDRRPTANGARQERNSTFAFVIASRNPGICESANVPPSHLDYPFNASETSSATAFSLVASSSAPSSSSLSLSSYCLRPKWYAVSSVQKSILLSFQDTFQ